MFHPSVRLRGARCGVPLWWNGAVRTKASLAALLSKTMHKVLSRVLIRDVRRTCARYMIVSEFWSYVVGEVAILGWCTVPPTLKELFRKTRNKTNMITLHPISSCIQNLYLYDRDLLSLCTFVG